MTKDEALKMAINAMIKPDNLSFLMAITACQDALEQPAWQGLMDDEIKQCATKLGYLWTEDSSISFAMDTILMKFARAIEQALKDKNGKV
jgi:hypothetical protein